ncbi:MAG TPA: helix-turn-helix domain-containing protein [Solirubrobacterales bacterium]
MGKQAGEEAAPGKAAASPKKKKGTNRLEAMNHPLRARVLRLLVERGVMSPAELSRTLRAELSDVSYHVRRLEKLECVELVDTQPVRGALEHFYRATERHLITTEEFEQLDPIIADDIVLDSFQRIIDDVVASRKAKMIGYDRHFYLARTPYVFDEEGYQEGMDAMERCREELSEIERKSAERRVGGAHGIAASGSLLFFKVPNASLNT